MSDLINRNFKALEKAMNTLHAEFSDLKAKQASLEGQNAALRVELNQIRQLSVAVMSRGTGPTKVS